MRNKIKEVLGSDKLDRAYRSFQQSIEKRPIKLPDFKLLEVDGAYLYVPEGTYSEIERFSKKQEENKITYYIPKTSEKVSITKGTYLHGREISNRQHDIESLACLCFYIANAENPIPYRCHFFYYVTSSERTAMNIGKEIIKIFRTMEKDMSKKNKRNSPKERALILLKACLKKNSITSRTASNRKSVSSIKEDSPPNHTLTKGVRPIIK